MRCSGQGVRVFPGVGWQMQAPCDECRPQGTLLGSCLWGQPGPPCPAPPPPSQASTTGPSPTFPGASRLAGGAWGGQIEGWAGGWGGGSPPRGRLDVAQIDSPPISSRANLEADQTRNPTAGAAEPGLIPSKPAPPPASPRPGARITARAQLPALPSCPAALRGHGGQPDAPPQAHGCPTPAQTPAGWPVPTALYPGQAGARPPGRYLTVPPRTGLGPLPAVDLWAVARSCLELPPWPAPRPQRAPGPLQLQVDGACPARRREALNTWASCRTVTTWLVSSSQSLKILRWAKGGPRVWLWSEKFR